MQAHRRINGWGPYIGPMLAALFVTAWAIIQDTPTRSEMTLGDNKVIEYVDKQNTDIKKWLERVEGKLDRALERRAEGN